MSRSTHSTTLPLPALVVVLTISSSTEKEGARLRHTFASLLLANGVDLPKVTNLLGHRDSTITLRVYAHFIRDRKPHVQDLANSILG